MHVVLRILSYLRPYKRHLILASLSMVMFVIFNMLVLVLLIPFINTLFDQKNAALKPLPELSFSTIKDWTLTAFNNFLATHDPITALQYLCVMVFGAFLFKNLFHYLQTYFMAPAEQGIIRDLRDELYSKMLNLSMNFFVSSRKGMLMSRIVNDVRLVNDSAIAVINSLFRDPPQLLTYILFLVFIDWKLTLISMTIAPVMGILISRISRWLRKESYRQQEAAADLTSSLDEGLTNMRIVKAFSAEKRELTRFQRHNQDFYWTFVKIKRRKELSSPVTEVLGSLVAVLILWFIGNSILTGNSEMSSGIFVAYIVTVLQMMQPLKMLSQTYSGLAEGLAGANRVFEMIDTAPEITDRSNARSLTEFQHDIHFDAVWFKYPTSDDILKGITLTIPAGSVVALVGPSGAGKSTLIDLIPRFYDVTGGAIRIDGTDIRDLTVTSLRGMMGIVSQETFLFNASIRDNIAFSKPDATDAEVEEAARLANAHEFIMETDQGYATVIGDRGSKLSGGQRQRIAIARAILKNPPILILDEATSALDTESEALVQQAIENSMRGRTTIVIAHRLSTIQSADKIVVIEDGVVRESGNHEELLERPDGVYRKLYSMQFQ